MSRESNLGSLGWQSDTLSNIPKKQSNLILKHRYFGNVKIISANHIQDDGFLKSMDERGTAQNYSYL